MNIEPPGFQVLVPMLVDENLIAFQIIHPPPIYQVLIRHTLGGILKFRSPISFARGRLLSLYCFSSLFSAGGRKALLMSKTVALGVLHSLF